MTESFGEELIQTFNYTASTHSYFWKSTTISDRTMGDILKLVQNTRDFSKIYKSKSSRPSASVVPRHVVIDQELPEKLQADISEPNVTSQLLDLNQTSLNIYSKGSKSVTEQTKGDILACVANGSQ